MSGIQEEATSLTKSLPKLDNIKTKFGFGIKDGRPPTPNATPHPEDIETITAKECLQNFNKFIDHEKPGLRSFYSEQQLEKLSVDAADMVNKLRKKKCGKETSKQLSILCLYDLVMLIDDSSSMSDEEDGNRINILLKTMKKITMVYDLARPAPDQGLVSVKFINCMKGYKNIDNRRVSHVLKKHAFWGTTQIGSALQKKVLDNFVFNPNAPMEKPLLVMTITDGGPEGESKNHLRNVIDQCVQKLEAQGGAGKDAVAFHFSRVGNDSGAANLLADLDECCESVDCLRAEYALERLSDKESQWDVLPKLLLGAIVSTINQNDDEELGKAEKPPPVHVESLEDGIIELDDNDSEGSDDDD
ncbi:uncharacterized protein H6S33_006980 [Morchella sextelata]|uniref:uncharacterized protein n=1 Tax=Morchella sextelata TaxID=1174677 RepID=UPI001D059F45|nr:uncharacterized protein H6S33_006980 [Morchella sextelata]KAH0603949.1 hypothetical protein H6S33_006980 [Morchella sextelata]